MTSQESVDGSKGLFQDAGDNVVVVGLGDLGSVEGAGDEGIVGPKSNTALLERVSDGFNL